MDKLKAMATFVRIVDTGSLSAAADTSGASAGSVVRTLAALEKHLGVRLLNRTTRRLALTEEGNRFLEWSRRILSEFDAIEHTFDASQPSAGGLVRITAPVEFGQRHVAPLVNEFLAAHPTMRIEMTLLDRMVDLFEDGLDLAIRIGQLPDSSMVATPLGMTRLVVCASPGFLRKAGPVASPSALRDVPCIGFAPQGKLWHFHDQGRTVTEVVQAPLVVNQVQAVRLACLQGLGVARFLHYQVASELSEGKLVRVLQAFEPPVIPIQMVYLHARLLAPRVRSFIDWASPRLSAVVPRPD